jgi:hypothetical protein
MNGAGPADGGCHPGEMSNRRYIGLARGLHAGAVISAPAVATSDPAQALVDAWRQAETSREGCVPYVYEVAAIDGGLIVLRDVLTGGATAWRAEELMRSDTGGAGGRAE